MPALRLHSVDDPSLGHADLARRHLPIEVGVVGDVAVVVAEIGAEVVLAVQCQIEEPIHLGLLRKASFRVGSEDLAERAIVQRFDALDILERGLWVKADLAIFGSAEDLVIVRLPRAQMAVGGVGQVQLVAVEIGDNRCP